ncbi:MAG: hypothetical protein ACREMB_14255, partial [Candidatus Rokuibacteriota bacterium]
MIDRRPCDIGRARIRRRCDRGGRWIGDACEYPYQANTYGLPIEIVTENLLGLIEAHRDRARNGPPAHFEAWINSGGDAEICFALRLAGWRLWFEPRMRLRHFIQTHRLDWWYLRRLFRGVGASSVGFDP